MVVVGRETLSRHRCKKSPIADLLAVFGNLGIGRSNTVGTEIFRYQELVNLLVALVHRIGLRMIDVIAVEVVSFFRHPPRPGEAVGIDGVDQQRGGARRLDEVVQGFLKFTRPEDLKLQPLALSALFGEVIPIVKPEAERAKVDLVFDCDGAIEVNGDPAMLRQAFLNLALNACQAMPQGGTLRIACEKARGRRVVITVSDTGVGIKPEHLKRIFDLYFTTKERGSGIGLSMVYRTVQMHDGEIEVQSTPGKGTTFQVILPQA